MISLYCLSHFVHQCFCMCKFFVDSCFEKNYLGSLLGGGVDNVLSNTLPLSEPMLAGITQHWGRFNEYILFHICFMFFLVYLCIYNYDLYH